VWAVAVLADGRVVTGGDDGRVLIWDPAGPGTAAAELGRLDGTVSAVAVLADGRVVTGGDDRRVLIWDVARPNTQVIQLSCSLTILATAPPGPSGSNLAIAHEGSWLSLWSVTHDLH
jgi:WD40 repeat protein